MPFVQQLEAPAVDSTKFAAGVAEASSFSAFCVILDGVAAFPVSGDKPLRHLGL